MGDFCFRVMGLFLLAVVAGCGGGASEPEYASARLEGAVTLDGQPLANGTIQFVPRDAASGPVTQATILQGRYVATKVPLGKATAILRVEPPAAPKELTSDYMPPETKTIPARYEDGFPIEVKADGEQDFPMSSK